VVLWNGSLVFLDWNGSLAFLDDVIVGCWDSYEDGTGDELKGRSVTKDGAKSKSPSKINLLNGTSPATLNPDVMFAGVVGLDRLNIQ